MASVDSSHITAGYVLLNTYNGVADTVFYADFASAVSRAELETAEAEDQNFPVIVLPAFKITPNA